ncbi:MAG: imidazole glycerol phosphate synthase subunit HisH [Crenarchaeota archaeon]|nr:imidazole glycerol phosphate synthase subunit HisH [Thermoproteota archaeon]
MKVGVVRYGVGNIGSVINALRKLNIDHIVITRESEIGDCDVVILPGVGSFDAAIRYIRSTLPIVEKLKGIKPVVGICLGMQIMFERSEEGALSGLSWFKGEVRRLQSRVVPHMGWNSVDIVRETMLDVRSGDYFYFAHSYCIYSNDIDPSILLGKTVFESSEFSSIIFDEKNMILGTQFHPERSSRTGLRLLSSFFKLCRK